MSLENTIKRLRALANNPATLDGEREAAKKAIERILINNPHLNLDDTFEPETAHIDIPYKDWQEVFLIYYAATFLGLTVYELRRTRTLKRLRIEGDARLLTTLKDLIEAYKPKLQDLLTYYMHGYLSETFPRPPSKEKKPSPELTDEQWEAARAGMAAGRPATTPHQQLQHRNPRGHLNQAEDQGDNNA